MMAPEEMSDDVLQQFKALIKTEAHLIVSDLLFRATPEKLVTLKSVLALLEAQDAHITQLEDIIVKAGKELSSVRALIDDIRPSTELRALDEKG